MRGIGYWLLVPLIALAGIVFIGINNTMNTASIDKTVELIGTSISSTSLHGVVGLPRGEGYQKTTYTVLKRVDGTVLGGIIKDGSSFVLLEKVYHAPLLGVANKGEAGATDGEQTTEDNSKLKQELKLGIIIRGTDASVAILRAQEGF